MLTIGLQIIEMISLVALLIVIWRVSQWPQWRVRAVIYGWAAVFLWAFLWAVVLPMALRGMTSFQLPADAFPDGTMAMAALFGGWVYPLTIVVISKKFQDRKQIKS